MGLHKHDHDDRDVVGGRIAVPFGRMGDLSLAEGKMIQNNRKCDGIGCEAITLDHMLDGWIIIGDGGFTKYKGRDKRRIAITEIFVANGSDFCSWKCLRSRTGYKK